VLILAKTVNHYIDKTSEKRNWFILASKHEEHRRTQICKEHIWKICIYISTLV